jgi:hypothetical protein
VAKAEKRRHVRLMAALVPENYYHGHSLIALELNVWQADSRESDGQLAHSKGNVLL